MKAILTTLILIFAVIGGAVGGDFMKSRKTDALSASVSHSSKDDKKSDKKKGDKKDDKKKDKKKDKKGDKKKGDKGGDYDTGGIAYLKFKRQFVVPVLERGRIDSLVIMNFNIELNDEAPDNVYSYEPKLRDAFMRELLSLSNDGMFGDQLTSPETYDVIREKILGASYSVVPSGIKDILILDIARQDQ